MLHPSTFLNAFTFKDLTWTGVYPRYHKVKGRQVTNLLQSQERQTVIDAHIYTFSQFRIVS